MSMGGTSFFSTLWVSSYSGCRGLKQLIYLFKGDFSILQDYTKSSEKQRKITLVLVGSTDGPGESFQSFTDSLDTPLSSIRKLGLEVYEKKQIWKGLPQRVEICQLPHGKVLSR